MDIHIRPAQTDDAPALAELLHALDHFAHLEAQLPDETHRQVTRALALDLAGDSHSVFVAHDPAGVIVAYAAVHWLPYLFLPGPEGYVSELFVRPAERGQGIGARLLDAIQAEARRRGCTRLSLLNRRARESYQRGFYSKHGWQERDMANFVFPLD